MSPFPQYSCASARPARPSPSLPFLQALACLLCLPVAVPAFAGGADVSTDELYSDDVTLTTFDGAPLDVNGDGHTDLAVAANSANPDLRSRYYLGNGDGTFVPAPVLLAIRASSEILPVDLDGNGAGIVDLVQGIRDDVSVFFLGNGTDVGTPNDVFTDTNRVLAVAAGDLDGDGDLDLVTGTGHPQADENLPLQRNRFYLNSSVPAGGVPAFTGHDISPDQDDTRSIALADMDGDGKLDVIAGNDETTPGSNLVYLNQTPPGGTVSFAAGVGFGPPDDQTGKLLIGDLDNDGDPDVVTLNFLSSGSATTNPSPGINRFFLNESTAGSPAFVEADVSADADMSSGGALADFDGDGDLDVAVANLLGNGLGQTVRNRLYLNQFVPSGTVSFSAGIDISPDEHQSREVAAGDINGDGHIDVVVGNQAFGGLPGRDRRYLNNGTADPFTNIAPVIDDQSALETPVDTALAIELDRLTVTDPDNVFPVDFTLTVQSGTNYTVSGATITPAAGFAGDLAVPVVVSDGTDDSAPFDLAVTVGDPAGANNPPSFSSTPVTEAAEDEAYAYDVAASDPDDGATLAITAATLPTWLALTDNGDGTASLAGTPASGDVGDHDVSLTVSDGTDSAAQDFTVTVTAASDPAPPPTTPGGDGGDSGGGSFGVGTLLALLACGALRRRRAHR